MQRPKVSVIIPCHNSERFLVECMDSVIGQTLKDIEIICVDDGSTDGTLGILNEYAKKDSRIQVMTQENQYAGMARNNGMEIAKGEYKKKEASYKKTIEALKKKEASYAGYKWKLEEVYSSNSWRLGRIITAPVRFMKKTFSGRK